ncbi:MAG: hypothetical protein IV108_05640 [Burkholderiales bacterium]|nr:hypothetical protein [Burkholderiales bacterium]
MARKPGPGTCVHCLKHADKRNWDHVFPQGWYPDTTPQNLEKWKIPSCKLCNDEYGRIEDELRIIFSTCIDPTSARASGIWAKTLRALDPRRAKNEKDRRARAEKKTQLLAKMLKGDAIPDQAIYPGLGERWDRPRGDQIAISVPANHLKKVVEKVIKGLAYIEDGRLIDAEMEITHHVVDQTGAKPIEELLAAFGANHSRGPGIEVSRAVTPEDGISAVYKITIWGEIVMYATVLPKSTQQSNELDA